MRWDNLTDEQKAALARRDKLVIKASLYAIVDIIREVEVNHVGNTAYSPDTRIAIQAAFKELYANIVTYERENCTT